MADDNKPMKYMRYAIGEIVLVVIGILIALQINNWNEERKDNNNKKVFKQALIEDLKKDTAHLNIHIKNAEIFIKNFKETTVKLEKSDVTIDTVIKLYTIRGIPQMGLEPPNKTTFESLMQTGNIKVFNEDEIERLMAFYDEIKLRYFLVEYGYNYSWEKSQELSDMFGFLSKKEKDSPVYIMLRENMNESEFVRMYDLALYRFLGASRNGKRRSEQLLIMTNELINTLSDSHD